MLNNNLNESGKRIDELLEVFSENTPVYKYISYLENILEDPDSLFVESYQKNIEVQKKKKEKEVFLSVIMRTQGKRPLGLREALLCLTAQEKQNFEIILIAHKATSKNKKIIAQIIEDQDEEFRKKIRYYEVEEGTRTTPINFGFSVAHGKYAAIFDDDDILFSNWSKAFFEAEKRHSGRILHTYAFAQQWKKMAGKHCEEGYCAANAPESVYCSKFILLEQLVVNRCPLMTLAFPVDIFQKLGIIFDESLNVTEDWEYLMRTAFLCGVSDIEEPTAIYRFWENVEASMTLHDENEWFKTYRAIQRKMDAKPVVMPEGNLSSIISLIEKNSSPVQLSAYPKLDGRLYFSKGETFSDLECLSCINEKKEPEFDLLFVFKEKLRDIRALRIDLCERGFWALKNIEITVWLTNGEKKIVPIEECAHNGLDFENCIIFLNEDPEIVWEWKDDRAVDVVRVIGEISMEIPNLPLLRTSLKHVSLKQYVKRLKFHKKNIF